MTTVLLLHGIPGCARDWSAVAAELAGDFEVWAPDLVGFGTRANGARDLWAGAQACALAAELPAARDLIVVGHDFGGPVALHLLPLIRGRVRGLVLAATNVFPDTPLPFPLSLVRLPGMPRVLFSAPSLRMMLRGHPDPVSAVGPPQQQAAIREIFTTGLRELPQRYEEVEQLLRSADVPIRVIWGDPAIRSSRSPKVGAQRRRRARRSGSWKERDSSCRTRRRTSSCTRSVTCESAAGVHFRLRRARPLARRRRGGGAPLGSGPRLRTQGASPPAARHAYPREDARPARRVLRLAAHGRDGNPDERGMPDRTRAPRTPAVGAVLGRVRLPRLRRRGAVDEYISLPFVLADWGTDELPNRRLRFRVPAPFRSHCRAQTIQLDERGLIVRHDYTAEAFGPWARAAHGSSRFKTFDGLPVPTRRRVRPRPLGPVIVKVDVTDAAYVTSSSRCSTLT